MIIVMVAAGAVPQSFSQIARVTVVMVAPELSEERDRIPAE